MNFPDLLNYLQNVGFEEGDAQDNVDNTHSPPLLEHHEVGEGDEILLLLRNPTQLELPNAFQHTDKFFSFCFMFEKQLARDFLLELAARTFYNPHGDTQRIPFDLRVLATLNFLAHGHLEHILTLNAFVRFRPSMLMRCVPKVCQEIVHFMTPDLLSFPLTDAELKNNKNSFLQQFGLPGVVGILDCFHVRLAKIPPQHQAHYRNRHGHTSLNVQVICDRNLRFLDVNARFSGSTSDIYIWKHSNVRSIMKQKLKKHQRTWLIADRGYRLESFLINPYRNAITLSQVAINAKLQQLCGVLDTGVAVLKARFCCLGSVLNFSHLDCANIITSCVTLHNYLITKDVHIAQNLTLRVPNRRKLPNASFEDVSREGLQNRIFLENFLRHNTLQQLLAA